MASITIKQLHERTGEKVRKAGQSHLPIAVTDRGKLVAVLAAPHLIRAHARTRTLLPEYAALMAKPAGPSVLDDLDALRGDR